MELIILVVSMVLVLVAGFAAVIHDKKVMQLERKLHHENMIAGFKAIHEKNQATLNKFNSL